MTPTTGNLVVRQPITGNLIPGRIASLTVPVVVPRQVIFEDAPLRYINPPLQLVRSDP